LSNPGARSRSFDFRRNAEAKLFGKHLQHGLFLVQHQPDQFTHAGLLCDLDSEAISAVFLPNARALPWTVETGLPQRTKKENVGKDDLIRTSMVTVLNPGHQALVARDQKRGSGEGGPLAERSVAWRNIFSDRRTPMGPLRRTVRRSTFQGIPFNLDRKPDEVAGPGAGNIYRWETDEELLKQPFVGLRPNQADCPNPPPPPPLEGGWRTKPQVRF